MGLKIDLFPCLSDNYGFLITDAATGLTAAVDTPEAEAIAARIDARGLKLDYILNTHWHPDHAGGNAALKDRFDCVIWGPEEARQTGPVDHILAAGDVFHLGETKLDVLDLAGHTPGQIGYWDSAGHNAFVGDAIFTLGCGKVWDTMDHMWTSLLRLAELPGTTRLFHAHEYTLTNLRFAESLGTDRALAARGEILKAMRAQGEPTVPTTVAEERLTNPFLVYPLREAGFEAQAAKFAEVRAAKDVFR
jgi:hydroxyacylglutathione hydrolase